MVRTCLLREEARENLQNIDINIAVTNQHLENVFCAVCDGRILDDSIAIPLSVVDCAGPAGATGQILVRPEEGALSHSTAYHWQCLSVELFVGR